MKTITMFYINEKTMRIKVHSTPYFTQVTDSIINLLTDKGKQEKKKNYKQEIY